MLTTKTTVLLACLSTVAAAACGSSTGPVAPPVNPPAENPDAPTGPLALQPGEVADLTVTEGTAGVRLETGGAAAEYVVVIGSTKFDTSGSLEKWSVSNDGAPEGARAALATGCSLGSEAWRSVPVPAEAAPTGTAVAQGARKTIHMSKGNSTEDIEVEAIAVGQRAIVWADVTAAHPATLDGAFVTQFLTDFENLILPRTRSIFGVESDLDADGHIGLVFTPVTKETSVAFFSGCDLVQMAGCPASNAGEYLYLTPPNAIEPPYNTPNAIKEILAHELSHLVHFNRKVVRNKATAWSDSGYMIEGFGAFAQDVIGMQAGNLYVTKAGLDSVSNFSLGDVFVDDTPYDMKRDGVMRGGSFLFVRWLYDQAGGDTAKADGTIEGRGGPAFLRAVLESNDSVAKTLPASTKSTAADIAIDFYTALAMDSHDKSGVAPKNSCFSYLPVEKDPVTAKPRGVDLRASFHGTVMTGVPITTAKSGELRSGGVAYVGVTAAEGQSELGLGVTVGAKALARVRVGRVR